MSGIQTPVGSIRLWRQRELAQAAIEAGALAVIGTHPHILQQWERKYATDGRQGLVIYSTGNLISAQSAPAHRVGIIAILELAKASGMVKARLAAARYVLTRIVEKSGITTVEEAEPTATVAALPAEDRVRIGDLGRGACEAKYWQIRHTGTLQFDRRRRITLSLHAVRSCPLADLHSDLSRDRLQYAEALGPDNGLRARLR